MSLAIPLQTKTLETPFPASLGMKIDTRNHSPRLLPAALCAATVLLSASCVTQARYDEAMQNAQYYQRGLQDLDSYVGELEAENELLRRSLTAYEEVETLESSYTKDIDERMEMLKSIAAGIGAAPGDVTVLPVEGGYGLRLSDAVLFDSGKAEVLPEGRELIGRLAAEIASRPYERIWVRGHTDSDPVKKPETVQRFPHGNLQLSTARAIEVAVLLREQPGIDAARIVAAGFGSSLSVVPNDSAENKRRNRRVEIFVIEDEEAAGGR